MQDGLKVAHSADDEPTDKEAVYLRLLTLIERLHRQLLDVIKNELERVGQTDINAVQALLLYNIGDAELTAGELRSRGHYLGSNVSYNLKKLVEAGYISHQRSDSDRRSVRVSLTEAGLDVRGKIADLFDRHLASVEKVGDVSAMMMERTNISLERLERFWADQIRYQL
ncbi:transcriptional regulator LdtR [Parvularcula oceani]|uniref:transcriptional regulator LdtR n=1 Tax=Parvularcula oceani TaxID=1247963 RepID=UPI000AB43849